MRIYLLEVIDEDRGDEVEVLYPPMGLAYIAGYVRARHSDWEIKIAQGGVGILDDIRNFVPDIIGVGFVTQNAMIAADVVRGIAVWGDGVPVVVGGHHVSAMPWWMAEETGVDVISVIGEGERTFYNICKEVLGGVKGWECLLGVGYIKDDEYVMNNSSVIEQSIDQLPEPAWDMVTYGGVDIQIFTSRGCPFDCIFCSSACFWGKPRYHSPMRIFKDIKRLYATHGVRNFNIYDDLFAIDKKRIAALIKCFEKDPMMRSADVQFSCLGRASVFDEEMAGLLQELGVQNIAFGFESGSDRVLKKLKGPTASVESNCKAAEIARKAGFGVVGSVIYGVPGETARDVEATVKMVQKMGLKTGEAYLATPYPGTQLWKDAEKRGLVSEDMDFSRLKFDWDDDAVIVSDTMEIEELKSFRSQFKSLF